MIWSNRGRVRPHSFTLPGITTSASRQGIQEQEQINAVKAHRHIGTSSIRPSVHQSIHPSIPSVHPFPVKASHCINRDPETVHNAAILRSRLGRDSPLLKSLFPVCAALIRVFKYELIRVSKYDYEYECSKWNREPGQGRAERRNMCEYCIGTGSTFSRVRACSD